MKKVEEYKYELGPIRPPSEANSLLLRVTRNCPWNRCKFCAVYQGKKFSIRPTEHVLKDIELLKRQGISPQSVFLQDANSLVAPAKDVVIILEELRKAFPHIERITTYARSHTVARMKDEDLAMLREAGLDRIHIGMESGSDIVLEKIKKGVTKEIHVKAGLKVKKANMELSEYIIPGLGGRELSEIHAKETADALNQIDPDFIRLRTLSLPKRCELRQEYQEGKFDRMNDIEMVEEIRMIIENLEGITSYVVSDHMMNLLPIVEGRMPDAKENILKEIDRFLQASEESQGIYIVGRRIGVMSLFDDIYDIGRRQYTESFLAQNNIPLDQVYNFASAISDRYM